MPKAYLTIDDGPSESFTRLVDFLAERGVPAVFFNRGDVMEARPDVVIDGIKKGYVMANHAYSHRRFSKLHIEKCQEEITSTEDILNKLYKKAGVERPGKYFRFPYMDRGMGPWLVEPDKLPDQHKDTHRHVLESGLGHKPSEPDASQVQKFRDLQQFLVAQGFERLPAKNVTLPWYVETGMADTIDALCTYSTSDWALLERHKGKHGFGDVADLKRKIDEDPFLEDRDSAHVILCHDDPEIFEVTSALIDYFLASGFEFLDFADKT